ncbi:amidohydrolase [Rhodofomes roseus]|uniref:Amidohydrolase n=1 Tax=Rhodofomes roseus TaxID=34475 RepID=A0ABQ8K614_9APHY|nr:amidohydrolase [Rhodofomes roseus]KAH9832533.1 amidohydrolase [Rhodofomes roseus]
MSDEQTQVGCFTRLLSFHRRRKSTPGVQVGLADGFNSMRQTSLPAAEVKRVAPESASDAQKGSEELPSYTQFANTCMCCDYTLGRNVHIDTEKPPSYGGLSDIFRPEVLKTIEETVDKYDSELRELSLDILAHPEIAWQEKRTHDKLTAYMSSHGFSVTPHYLGLSTAWRAVFSHTSSSASAQTEKPRVIGVNSEMDALPGVGHACGHNLIAIAGVGVALAIKAALEKHDVSGQVVLLGTPAEEGGGGKISLLDAGAYDDMDACIMCHPGGGPDSYASIGPSLASQPLEVEFFGHGAHAAWAPWEAQNALDAAFLAYSSVAVLRQQIKPTHRVHGIVSGKDWAPNIVPDYAKMRWIVRAPTWGEVEVLRERVKACFEGAAHATGCKLSMSIGVGYYELRQNQVLGTQYAEVIDQYGVTAKFDEGMAASTDFGNVTYALPSLHPNFTIPTEPNGGNHTPQFTKSAGTIEAHRLAIKTIKALALTGFRVVDDAQFAEDVRGLLIYCPGEGWLIVSFRR